MHFPAILKVSSKGLNILSMCSKLGCSLAPSAAVLTFNQGSFSLLWLYWLFAAVLRQTATDSIFPAGELHSCPEHILINEDKLIQYTNRDTDTTCARVFSQQTKPTHIFLSKTLSFLLSPDFYLLGGWALTVGLILSYHLELVPRGQLCANTQQSLSIYSARSYTLCYTITTYSINQHKYMQPCLL